MKRNDLEAIADRIRAGLPDLTVVVTARGLHLRWEGGSVLLDRASIRSRSEDRREVSRWISQGRSFFEPRSGVLHVRAKGAYIHAVLRPVFTSWTPIQLGLLACICEQHLREARWRLPGGTMLLHRLFSTWTGATISAMTVARFLAKLREERIAREEEEGTCVHIQEGLRTLAERFTPSRLGRKLHFHVSSAARIHDIIDKLHPLGLGILGIADLLEGEGFVLDERDAIVSPEAIPHLRSELGPPIRRPGAKASHLVAPLVVREGAARPSITLCARVTSKAAPRIFAGDASRKTLNPLLAAAAAMHMSAPVKEYGRSLWERMLA